MQRQNATGAFQSASNRTITRPVRTSTLNTNSTPSTMPPATSFGQAQTTLLPPTFANNVQQANLYPSTNDTFAPTPVAYPAFVPTIDTPPQSFQPSFSPYNAGVRFADEVPVQMPSTLPAVDTSSTYRDETRDYPQPRFAPSQPSSLTSQFSPTSFEAERENLSFREASVPARANVSMTPPTITRTVAEPRYDEPSRTKRGVLADVFEIFQSPDTTPSNNSHDETQRSISALSVTPVDTTSIPNDANIAFQNDTFNIPSNFDRDSSLMSNQDAARILKDETSPTTPTIPAPQTFDVLEPSSQQQQQLSPTHESSIVRKSPTPRETPMLINTALTQPVSTLFKPMETTSRRRGVLKTTAASRPIVAQQSRVADFLEEPEIDMPPIPFKNTQTLQDTQLRFRRLLNPNNDMTFALPRQKKNFQSTPAFETSPKRVAVQHAVIPSSSSAMLLPLQSTSLSAPLTHEQVQNVLHALSDEQLHTLGKLFLEWEASDHHMIEDLQSLQNLTKEEAHRIFESLLHAHVHSNISPNRFPRRPIFSTRPIANKSSMFDSNTVHMNRVDALVSRTPILHNTAALPEREILIHEFQKFPDALLDEAFVRLGYNRHPPLE